MKSLRVPRQRQPLFLCGSAEICTAFNFSRNPINQELVRVICVLRNA